MTEKEYPTREIFMNGRYIICQVMNWEEGPPPKYLLCNPLDPQHIYRQPFFAKQGLGTWMKADVFEIAKELNKA